MNNSDKERKILTLIKLFNNRPHVLTRYLIQNSAFSNTFLDKLMNNKKIDDILKGDMDNIIQDYDFNTISDVENYYNSFLEESGKTRLELSNELNTKLKNAIKNEKYEDAAKIRDYMKKNNIKKK